MAGLTLRLGVTGGLRSTLPEKKRLALDVYPDVSLKMARLARDKARELLAQGINPCEQKKQDKAKARRLEQESRLTFEIVAREWFEKKTRNLTLTYRKQKRQRLEKYLFPTVGNISMAELDLPDLAATLKPLHGKADMSKRVAEIVGQVCRDARVMKYARYDVSAGLTETLPDKPPVRHRAALQSPK